jgi:hypothetical protein
MGTAVLAIIDVKVTKAAVAGNVSKKAADPDSEIRIPKNIPMIKGDFTMFFIRSLRVILSLPVRSQLTLSKKFESTIKTVLALPNSINDLLTIN